ncbi:MAG: hypothetical protein NT062_09400, partial [Proteobacteria bacterium]|nr:hypothetical protein [Pseudomonadota bacterium]
MVRKRSTQRKKTARPAYVGDRSLTGTPARRGSGWIVLVLGALVVVNLYVFVWDSKSSIGAIKNKASDPAMAIADKVLEPTVPVATAVTGNAAGSGGAAAPVAPPGVIDGKVGKTDTLGRVLKKSGLDAAEANEIIRALTGVLDFRTIRQGQTYRLERGPDGRVRAFD